MTGPDFRAEKLRAASLSIASNSVLVLGKLVIGLLTHSVSVMSEAIHSASDLLASLLAFFSIRAASAPADDEHPYGHGKAESLSSLFQAILIFAGACVVIVEAVRKLQRPGEIETGPAIIVMGVSMVVNSLISAYLLRTAKKTESLALKADGYHLLTDVWTSAGVFAGLVIVHYTRWLVVDALAALVVSVLILHTSWKLARDSVDPLMDRKLPAGEEALIREILLSDSRVRGYHKLRTRQAGHQRHVDVHVQLPDELTLVDAHGIVEGLEETARRALQNLEITIHFEPYEDEIRHQEQHHAAGK